MNARDAVHALFMLLHASLAFALAAAATAATAGSLDASADAGAALAPATTGLEPAIGAVDGVDRGADGGAAAVSVNAAILEVTAYHIPNAGATLWFHRPRCHARRGHHRRVDFVGDIGEVHVNEMDIAAVLQSGARLFRDENGRKTHGVNRHATFDLAAHAFIYSGRPRKLNRGHAILF